MAIVAAVTLIVIHHSAYLPLAHCRHGYSLDLVIVDTDSVETEVKKDGCSDISEAKARTIGRKAGLQRRQAQVASWADTEVATMIREYASSS